MVISSFSLSLKWSMNCCSVCLNSGFKTCYSSSKASLSFWKFFYLIESRLSCFFSSVSFSTLTSLSRFLDELGFLDLKKRLKRASS